MSSARTKGMEADLGISDAQFDVLLSIRMFFEFFLRAEILTLAAHSLVRPSELAVPLWPPAQRSKRSRMRTLTSSFAAQCWLHFPPDPVQHVHSVLWPPVPVPARLHLHLGRHLGRHRCRQVVRPRRRREWTASAPNTALLLLTVPLGLMLLPRCAADPTAPRSRRVPVLRRSAAHALELVHQARARQAGMSHTLKR